MGDSDIIFTDLSMNMKQSKVTLFASIFLVQFILTLPGIYGIRNPVSHDGFVPLIPIGIFIFSILLTVRYIWLFRFSKLLLKNVVLKTSTLVLIPYSSNSSEVSYELIAHCTKISANNLFYSKFQWLVSTFEASSESKSQSAYELVLKDGRQFYIGPKFNGVDHFKSELDARISNIETQRECIMSSNKSILNLRDTLLVAENIEGANTVNKKNITMICINTLLLCFLLKEFQLEQAVIYFIAFNSAFFLFFRYASRHEVKRVSAVQLRNQVITLISELGESSLYRIEDINSIKNKLPSLYDLISTRHEDRVHEDYGFDLEFKDGSVFYVSRSMENINELRTRLKQS